RAGDLLEFNGGVVLEVTEPRIPCSVLDGIDAWGGCGTMASVVQTGALLPGDAVRVTANRFQYTTDLWPHTGVILAGGESTRMGRPKECIILPDGRTMLRTMVDLLRSVCGSVAIGGLHAGQFGHLRDLGITII